MNKSLRSILSLSWQSVTYGLGILSSQLIVYLMLPFLTRYISQEEYGIISVISAMFTFFNTATNAGLPSTTIKFFNNSQNTTDRRITIGSSQFLFFLFSFLPALIVLFFPIATSSLLLGSIQYTLVLQVVACYLVVTSMNTFGSVILRIKVRPMITSVHNIILITFQVGLTMLFVIVYKMGGLGYWFGQLLGGFIGLLFMVWFISKEISFQLSWNRVWELIKFGFPLIPATLSMNVLRMFDRYIIGSLAGLDQVAIYDIGYKVGTLILFVIIPFRTAWIPFAFSIANETHALRIYRDVLTYITAGCSFLILCVITFQRELINLLAPAEYNNAITVVGWVAVSQLFLAQYHVLAIELMNKNKTHLLSLSGLVAACINLLLNFILIPRVGILGAGIATFVGYFILVSLTHRLSKQQTVAILIDWKRIMLLFAISGLIFLIIFIINNITTHGSWINISLKSLGLLLFPVFLLLASFLNHTQGLEIMEIGKHIINRQMNKKDEKLTN